MRSLLLAVLPTAVACAPVFALDEAPACPQDILPLDGGLALHLSQGGGASFDYDPSRPLEASVVGSYDLVSGAFHWVRTYDDGYWLRQEAVVGGVGTVYTNGDVDLAYDRQQTDTTGVLPVERVREVREGCVVERDVSSLKGAPVRTERGSYGDDGYRYTLTREKDGALVETTGHLARDFTRTESESWRVGSLQVEEESVTTADGKVVTDYDRLGATSHEYGTHRTRPDGVRTFDYTLDTTNLSSDWSYTRDLRGDGDGEVEFTPLRGDPYTCEVLLDHFDCTVQCAGQPDEGC